MGRERKKVEGGGWGRGKAFPSFPSPTPSFYFCSRPIFRAFCCRPIFRASFSQPYMERMNGNACYAGNILPSAIPSSNKKALRFVYYDFKVVVCFSKNANSKNFRILLRKPWRQSTIDSPAYSEDCQRLIHYGGAWYLLLTTVHK